MCIEQVFNIHAVGGYRCYNQQLNTIHGTITQYKIHCVEQFVQRWKVNKTKKGKHYDELWKGNREQGKGTEWMNERTKKKMFKIQSCIFHFVTGLHVRHSKPHNNMWLFCISETCMVRRHLVEKPIPLNMHMNMHIGQQQHSFKMKIFCLFFHRECISFLFCSSFTVHSHLCPFHWKFFHKAIPMDDIGLVLIMVVMSDLLWDVSKRVKNKQNHQLTNSTFKRMTSKSQIWIIVVRKIAPHEHYIFNLRPIITDQRPFPFYCAHWIPFELFDFLPCERFWMRTPVPSK